MVPKRMEASCLAEPPVGRSSSSEESASVVVLASQSSVFDVFALPRVGRVAGGEVVSKEGVRAESCAAMRWKGLVETSLAGGGFCVTWAWAAAASLAWAIFFRKGFLVSVSGGGLVTD